MLSKIRVFDVFVKMVIVFTSLITTELHLALSTVEIGSTHAEHCACILIGFFRVYIFMSL